MDEKKNELKNKQGNETDESDEVIKVVDDYDDFQTMVRERKNKVEDEVASSKEDAKKDHKEKPLEVKEKAGEKIADSEDEVEHKVFGGTDVSEEKVSGVTKETKNDSETKGKTDKDSSDKSNKKNKEDKTSDKPAVKNKEEEKTSDKSAVKNKEGEKTFDKSAAKNKEGEKTSDKSAVKDKEGEKTSDKSVAKNKEEKKISGTKDKAEKEIAAAREDVVLSDSTPYIHNSKKTSSSKKGVFITLGVLVSLLIVAYVSGFVYFSNHFYQHVTVNGIDVSGMNKESAKNVLDSFYNNYNLTLKTIDLDEITIEGKDIGNCS